MHAAIRGLAGRLVQEHFLTESQALLTMRQARARQTTFVYQLIDGNQISQEALAAEISAELGLPLLDLSACDVEAMALDEVVDEQLERRLAVPLARRNNQISIAVTDPTDTLSIRELEFQLGASADLLVATRDQLAALRERHKALARGRGARFTELEDLPIEELAIETATPAESAQEAETANEAPVIRAVNRIVNDAVQLGASDIHIETYENLFRIRLRIDGILRTVAAPPISTAARIVSRIKIMSHMDISERRLPQDGRIRIRLGEDRPIDFRVSSLPTLWGEKLVLRVLDTSRSHLEIDRLGFAPEQESLFRSALNRPQGMILVTGPTGSGKTVTLYSGLATLNTERRNVSTAEDPVEFNLPGINQLQINPRIGLNFAAALRTFLRQDPDVIMVGEVRDGETAEIAVKAAQTGHLVLSTLHTNSAVEALTRLQNMGIAAWQLCTSIELIVAQRLARRLCEQCRKPGEIPAQWLNDERLGSQLASIPHIYRAVGCNHCHEGYVGRIGIYEVVPINGPMTRTIIAGGSSMEVAEEARKAGFISLRQAAIDKVRQGLTTLDEALRLT